MGHILMVRNVVAVAAITFFSIGLSGCDYWPPALQTQIEQIRSELQNATVERTQSQNQLASMTKVRDDLQAQVDDLSRSNREKTSMINSLQNGLTAAQARLAKSAKSGSQKAGASKTSLKVAPKAPVKKKPSARATH